MKESSGSWWIPDEGTQWAVRTIRGQEESETHTWGSATNARWLKLRVCERSLRDCVQREAKLEFISIWSSEAGTKQEQLMSKAKPAISFSALTKIFIRLAIFYHFKFVPGETFFVLVSFPPGVELLNFSPAVSFGTMTKEEAQKYTWDIHTQKQRYTIYYN